MIWREFSGGDDCRQTMGLVDEVVTMFRNRGYRSAIAIEQTALALGLSERRVRSIFYGEAFTLAAGEYAAIRRQYMNHLDVEADHLASRFEAIKAKRRQMELEI